jgi:hypothetical protein
MIINRSEQTKIGETLQPTIMKFTPSAADSSREAFRLHLISRESTTQTASTSFSSTQRFGSTKAIDSECPIE